MAETNYDEQKAKGKIIHTMTLDVFSEHDLGSNNPRWSSTVVNDQLDGLARTMKNVTFGSGIEPDGLPITFPVETKEWLRHVASELKSCRNRRFVALQQYQLSLCPENVAKDDVIAILHGLSVPAVLRPVDDSYFFVGPCFVDGMMYGEACTWNEDAADNLTLL